MLCVSLLLFPWYETQTVYILVAKVIFTPYQHEEAWEALYHQPASNLLSVPQRAGPWSQGQ